MTTASHDVAPDAAPDAAPDTATLDGAAGASTAAASAAAPVADDREDEDEAPTPLDGRAARGQRTRSAVVDALLALHHEGDLTPTAVRVAERAGVALRTVFGHFCDLETLWAEAGARELQRLGGLAVRIDPALPLEERISLFCTSRARVLEALLPVMRAARLREHASPALAANRRLFVEAGDEEVRSVFAAEVTAGDDTLLFALALVAGAGGWESLRLDRGLLVDAATEVLRRTVSRLVAPPTDNTDTNDPAGDHL